MDAAKELLAQLKEDQRKSTEGLQKAANVLEKMKSTSTASRSVAAASYDGPCSIPDWFGNEGSVFYTILALAAQSTNESFQVAVGLGMQTVCKLSWRLDEGKGEYRVSSVPVAQFLNGEPFGLGMGATEESVFYMDSSSGRYLRAQVSTANTMVDAAVAVLPPAAQEATIKLTMAQRDQTARALWAAITRVTPEHASFRLNMPGGWRERTQVTVTDFVKTNTLAGFDMVAGMEDAFMDSSTEDSDEDSEQDAFMDRMRGEVVKAVDSCEFEKFSLQVALEGAFEDGRPTAITQCREMETDYMLLTRPHLYAVLKWSRWVFHWDATSAQVSELHLYGTETWNEAAKIAQDKLAHMQTLYPVWSGGVPNWVKELELKFAFEAVDADGSGDLEEKEVVAALRRAGVEDAENKAKAMLEEADVDKSGTVDFSEFRAWYLGQEAGKQALSQLSIDVQVKKAGAPHVLSVSPNGTIVLAPGKQRSLHQSSAGETKITLDMLQAVTSDPNGSGFSIELTGKKGGASPLQFVCLTRARRDRAVRVLRHLLDSKAEAEEERDNSQEDDSEDSEDEMKAIIMEVRREMGPQLANAFTQSMGSFVDCFPVGNEGDSLEEIMSVNAMKAFKAPLNAKQKLAEEIIGLVRSHYKLTDGGEEQQPIDVELRESVVSKLETLSGASENPFEALMGAMGGFLEGLGGDLSSDDSYDSDEDSSDELITNPEQWRELLEEIKQDAAESNAQLVSVAQAEEEQVQKLAQETLEITQALKYTVEEKEFALQPFSQAKVTVHAAPVDMPEMNNAYNTTVHPMERDVLQLAHFLQHSKHVDTAVVCPFPETLDDAELSKRGLFGSIARASNLLQVLQANNVPCPLPEGAIVCVEGVQVFRKGGNVALGDKRAEPAWQLNLVLATPVECSPALVELERSDAARPDIMLKLADADVEKRIEQQVQNLMNATLTMGAQSITFPPFACGRAAVPPETILRAVTMHAARRKAWAHVAWPMLEDEFSYLEHNPVAFENAHEVVSIAARHVNKEKRVEDDNLTGENTEE